MRNITPEVPVPLVDTPEAAVAAAPMAVGRLFETLRPELLRFAWWLSRNRAVAEDVVQEA